MNNEELKKDYGTLIARKSERLVTALYLVTDLIDDKEPIKQGLRKSAVALLSSMNSLAQIDVKDKVAEFKNSLRSVTEILSLLQVSVTTGIVSDMNGNILIDGFRSLQLVLEKKQPILTKEMLTIDNEADLNSEPSSTNAITSTSYDVLTPLAIARIKDNEDKKTVIKPSTINVPQKIDRNTDPENKKEKLETSSKQSQHTHNTSAHQNIRPIPSFATSFQARKHSRSDQILALFVKGVDISIKDISTRIKGCSEKTIQRELNNLVSSGKIQRIGEKRWSRYILK